jgi:hypothetical protein
MPTSKTFHPRNRVASDRFEGAGTEAAPVRYLQRAREEMLGAAFHAILLAGFLVALAFLAVSLRKLFAVHGGKGAAWQEPLTLVGLIVGALVIVRKLVARIRAFLVARREISALQAQVAALREQMRRGR